MARRNILHSSPRNGYITLLFSCSKEITELVLLCPSGFKWLFNLVQSLSHVQHFVTPWTAAHRLPCPSPSPGASSNSWPLSWWCRPTISSSGFPFSSCLQSSPPSGSIPVSRLFTSHGERTEASASASVLPVNIQGWFPLGLTGLILLSRDSLICEMTI